MIDLMKDLNFKKQDPFGSVPENRDCSRYIVSLNLFSFFQLNNTFTHVSIANIYFLSVEDYEIRKIKSPKKFYQKDGLSFG